MKQKTGWNIKWKEIGMIVVGTALMAAAINLIYDPFGLVTGGVTGLAIIIKSMSGAVIPGGIPVWLTNLLINVPLFLTALYMKGKRYIFKTLFAALSLTVFLYLIPAVPILEGDYLIATVLGAVLSGAGIGMVFATMATTGGTDLLCALIHEKKKYYSIPQLLAVVDGTVVVLGVFVFGLHHAIYAVIAVYLCAKISDTILEGTKFAKAAFIISDRYQEIAGEIMTGLDRGVTGIDITGMYSNEAKKMLYCVVSKKEIVEIMDIVHKNDPKAFVIVSDAREVMGEGFIEFKQ